MISSRSLQQKYPFVFVFLVFQFCHQNGFQGERDVAGKRLGTAVTDAVQMGVHRAFQLQNTCDIAHRSLRCDRLLRRAAASKLQITQIKARLKRSLLAGRVYQL